MADAKDDGGRTNQGISQDTVDRLRKSPEWQQLPANAFDLTNRQIDDILRKEYFDGPQIAKLAAVLGLADSSLYLVQQIFDAGVNHGTTPPGRWLQQALDETFGTDLRSEKDDGTKAYDGIIGSRTRAVAERAVREGKIKDVNNRIVDKRERLMREIVVKNPEKGRYLKGWLKRAESFRVP